MIYTIYMQNDDTPPPSEGAEDARFDGAVAIPESLAKWAIVFPPFWLAWHRLWWPLVIYMLVVILSLSAFAVSRSTTILILASLPGLYLLLEGHQLRRQKYESQGFNLVDVIDASNEQSAINRFIANWKDQDQPSPKFKQTFPKRPQPSPSLGLFSGNEG